MGFPFRKSVSNGSGEPRRGSQPGLADLIAQRELPLSERPRARLSRPRRGIAIAALAVAVLAIVVLAALYWTSGTPQRAKQPTALVTANRLNCRAAPSPDAAVVALGERAETVVVEAQNGSWRRVQLRGAHCWVSGEFLQPAS
jgi:SH3 domain-containing protein